MSTFRRLLGTAQKALDAKSSGPSHSGQGSDWRSLVRSAADTLTGDSASPRENSPRRDQPQDPRRDARGPDSSRWTATRMPTTSVPSVDRSRTTDSGPGGATGAVGSGPGSRASAADTADLSAEDRRAIARYDYLVRTAEPDQLERVHREAFEKLTPKQRAQLGETMRSELPEGERPRSEAPQDLARSATRLGALDPRRLTGLLGRSGNGRRGLGAGAVGAAAVGAGGLLAAVAGGAIVTSVGGSLLQEAIGSGIDVDSLAPDLANDLGGFTEGFEGFEGFEGMEGFDGVEGFEGFDGAQGLEGLSDGLGGSVSGFGDQVSGLGDQISGLGMDDLFGR